MSINDYFEVEGEDAFRHREAEMLERLLKMKRPSSPLEAGLWSTSQCAL